MGLCSDLSFTLWLRKMPENHSQEIDYDFVISHFLKWGPLPPNEVGRIAQHVKEEEGRRERKNKEYSDAPYCIFPLVFLPKCQE